MSLLLVVILTLDVIGQCEGWWGRRSSSSSGSRSSSSRSSSSRRSSSGTKVSSSTNDRGVKTVTNGKQTVKVGLTGIRDRDKTGHRTGLGTLAKKVVQQPVKTAKAVWEMGKSYVKMRNANVKGGNLKAHEEANRKATEVSDAKTAAALSAAREQYKRHRKKTNPDGSLHIGDTRSQQKVDDTMAANKRGRESANPNNG